MVTAGVAAGALAGDDVKVGPAAEVAPLAVGKVMVTPAAPQNCWANARVAA